MAATQFCPIDGQQIAYHQCGAGDPILLVHGITTYSFVWRTLLPFLTDKYTVYSLDLLGCGESAMPLDQSYALTDHAARIVAFMEQLQLDRPHLVGHDLGGGISQIVATRHREKLRSLTLINSVGYDDWPVQPIRAMRTPIIRQLLMALVDRKLFRVLVDRGLFHKELLTPELLELFWKPFTAPLGRQAFLHFARCLDNRNLTEIAAQLQTLELPTLILWGEADPYLSRTIADRLHREIPGSRLQQIATAGHYLILDEPQWVAEQIDTFIQGIYATD